MELKINYLKPVWKTKLKAHAVVTKNGNNIGFIECNLFDEKES
ncbi:hypothetical protein E2R56_07835 [Rhodococcus qingshengii]|nr:hypothetical protein E2R56_07835 [Rhodococcus qingshengii]